MTVRKRYILLLFSQYLYVIIVAGSKGNCNCFLFLQLMSRITVVKHDLPIRVEIFSLSSLFVVRVNIIIQILIACTGWLIKSGPFHFVAYNVYTPTHWK